MIKEEIIGKKFNHLTVIELDEERNQENEQHGRLLVQQSSSARKTLEENIITDLLRFEENVRVISGSNRRIVGESRNIVGESRTIS